LFFIKMSILNGFDKSQLSVFICLPCHPEQVEGRVGVKQMKSTICHLKLKSDH
jgi:hypothetical protein